jgi:hypothetical protein
MATRCLLIAALDSVMVSKFVAFLNITAEASVISISRGKMGSEQHNRGMVFRYFSIDARLELHKMRQVRYFNE